jgi:hypothetical protein
MYLSLTSMLAEAPFAGIEAVMHAVLHCLKGRKAGEMREIMGMPHIDILRPTHEKEMVEYLVAWSQCNLIPAFTSHNKKVFQDCKFRPDVMWNLADPIVILECDQDAHKGYDRNQEFERMQVLIHSAQNTELLRNDSDSKNVVFIRFNPSLRGTNSKLKHATLLSVLFNVFARKYTGKNVIRLFYPDAPHIWHDK